VPELFEVNGLAIPSLVVTTRTGKVIGVLRGSFAFAR